MYRRLSILLTMVVIISCLKEKESQKTVAEQLDEKLDLNDAIIKIPPKRVAISATLDFEFRKAVIPSHLGGTVLDKNPFHFTPTIRGHAKWLSTKLLRFIPDNGLPAGEEVEGVLKSNE